MKNEVEGRGDEMTLVRERDGSQHPFEAVAIQGRRLTFPPR